jgi:hypothetical protein
MYRHERKRGNKNEEIKEVIIKKEETAKRMEVYREMSFSLACQVGTERSRGMAPIMLNLNAIWTDSHPGRFTSGKRVSFDQIQCPFFPGTVT